MFLPTGPSGNSHSVVRFLAEGATLTVGMYTIAEAARDNFLPGPAEYVVRGLK